MINRDQYGIIVQHDIYDWSKPFDGGDSANRTGIMAVCGSRKDQLLLHMFHKGKGVCVRHPFQAIPSSPNTFTRDQLVCYVAGLRAAEEYDIARAILTRVLNRGGFLENTHEYPELTKKKLPITDFCHPGVVWHLILCAKAWWLYWLFPIGYFFQILEMIWATQIAPYEEQNQVFCMMYVSRLLPWYVKMHPDITTALNKYWNGWRNQPEISEAMLEIVKKKTNRF